jgi:hypothetical protein
LFGSCSSHAADPSDKLGYKIRRVEVLGQLRSAVVVLQLVDENWHITAEMF